jgi:uncharacterized membrane protein YfcA
LPAHATLVLVIFLLSVVMIMSGRGGGNFYVLALVLGGVPVHVAATTSQFILVCSALAGVTFFGKAKAVSWPLAFFFGGLNGSMAFLGGFEAHRFSGLTLKVVLSVLLGIAGAAMLFPEREGRPRTRPGHGHWNLRDNDALYVVDLRLAVPLTMLTGFFSGMVGISGGSFLVPLMVIGCGVPMRTAVGTASAMLAATALGGFSGSALHGGFDASLALPGAVAAVVGGLLGGRIALETKPRDLRFLSGTITMVAAVVMMANALSEK